MKSFLENIRAVEEIFKQLNYILTKSQKSRSVWVALNMLVAAAFDTLGVAAIMPFITALTNVESVKKRWYAKWLINSLGIKSDKGIMIAIGFAIILIYIVKNLYLWLYQCILIRYQCSVQEELSVKMLVSYMKRPYRFFRKTNSSVILRGTETDVNAVYTIIYNLFAMLSQGVTIVMISAFLVVQEPEMTLGLLLAATVSVILITFLFKNKVSIAGKANQDSASEKYAYAYQAVTGIKEISVMQRRKYFTEKYKSAYQKYVNAQISYNKIQACPIRIIETTFITFIIGTVCIRIIQGMNPVDYVSQLATFAVAGFRLMPMITALPNCLSALIFNRLPLEEAYDNIKTAREIDNRENRIDGNSRMEEVKEEIPEFTFSDVLAINNISFRFEDGIENVLDSLSLNIHKGESIGLIGESGAGKSTLADIIMGLQRPQTGAVTVDENDIYKIPVTWSKMIGYIPQTVFLIDDTIRRNVTFGLDDSDISDEKVWKALKQAQIADFVRSLSNGLDTVVGERGVKFSGGQRQRIAIARALYYDPSIIVMDEATSALDNDTETAVMQSINELQGQKTLIIVAHRLTTIRNCDKIYEISGGKAIERSKQEVFG